jgi:hypothetical protein
MRRVLSNDLWTEVRKQARASKLRKAAIAYVTRDLVGFREGDTLVVHASPLAIKNGETDAPLLRRLHRKVRRGGWSGARPNRRKPHFAAR